MTREMTSCTTRAGELVGRAPALELGDLLLAVLGPLPGEAGVEGEVREAVARGVEGVLVADPVCAHEGGAPLRSVRTPGYSCPPPGEASRAGGAPPRTAWQAPWRSRRLQGQTLGGFRGVRPAEGPVARLPGCRGQQSAGFRRLRPRRKRCQSAFTRATRPRDVSRIADPRAVPGPRSRPLRRASLLQLAWGRHNSCTTSPAYRPRATRASRRS